MSLNIESIYCENGSVVAIKLKTSICVKIHTFKKRSSNAFQAKFLIDSAP